MRSPPAVTLRCVGGRVWRHVQWALPALAAAAVAFWLAQHAALPPVLGLAAAIISAAAIAFFVSRNPSPAPELRWDGAVWTCEGQPVQPQVMIDSGCAWMLLRLQARPRPEAAAWRRRRRSNWVAVSKHDCGADWHAWRAAVYCPPPEPPAHGGARQSP